MKKIETEKVFVSPADLVKDSFTLGEMIYQSGYAPDVLLGVWRGGAPVAAAVHEYLMFKGVNPYHNVIKAESYTGIGERGTPKIENIQGILDATGSGARMLVIDDIFDSGATLTKIASILSPPAAEVRIATLYYKPIAGTAPGKPDYYLHATARWVVFPHELVGLSREELQAKGGLPAGL
jgi:hypoxanthine phosphoribosyltransferase